MKTKLNLEQVNILLGLGFTGDFSLQNMLELVPPYIEDEDIYDIQIGYCNDSVDQKWGIYYISEVGDVIEDVNGSEELIDVLFDWLVYLTNNNYISF